MASKSSDDAKERAKQEAEQRARDEAERKRKAEINGKITAKTNQIIKLNSIKSELSQEKTDMETSIGKWTTAKTTFNNQDITKKVVVKNVFEGNAAKAVKEANDKKISNMDKKIDSAKSIKDGISTQEGKINTKITSLNSEIRSLKSQL